MSLTGRIEYLEAEVATLQTTNQRLEDKLFAARQGEKAAIGQASAVAAARIVGPQWPIGLHWRGLARHFLRIDPEFAGTRLSIALEMELAEVAGQITRTFPYDREGLPTTVEIAFRLIQEERAIPAAT